MKIEACPWRKRSRGHAVGLAACSKGIKGQKLLIFNLHIINYEPGKHCQQHQHHSLAWIISVKYHAHGTRVFQIVWTIVNRFFSSFCRVQLCACTQHMYSVLAIMYANTEWIIHKWGDRLPRAHLDSQVMKRHFPSPSIILTIHLSLFVLLFLNRISVQNYDRKDMRRQTQWRRMDAESLRACGRVRAYVCTAAEYCVPKIKGFVISLCIDRHSLLLKRCGRLWRH